VRHPCFAVGYSPKYNDNVRKMFGLLLHGTGRLFQSLPHAVRPA
jgi:hypothetical protein